MNELGSFFISMLANIATDLGKNAIFAIKESTAPQKETEAIKKGLGIIEIDVSNGTISLFGAKLQGLNIIRSDHGDGQLTLDQTLMKAGILQMGGLDPNSCGSSGLTVITDSVFEAGATKMLIGAGCTATISGNASIHQS